MNRRTFLEQFLPFSTVGFTTATLNNRFAGAEAQVRSLRHIASARGLLYGAAADYAILSSNQAFAAHFAQECGILVPENSLKWRTLRPTPDTFNFANGDWLAEFARRHRMQYRGHTLVWYRSLPDWFLATVNRHNAAQYLTAHITTVVQHYAGQMHSWDVVNEAIKLEDNQPLGLRNTPWLQLLGPDYLEIAYRAAAEADPKALLTYNEYGLEYDDPKSQAKRDAVLSLLKRLKTQGVPIHALGIQAHLNGALLRDPQPHDIKSYQEFLRAVADLDLKILITELDVRDNGLPKAIADRDRIIADIYHKFLTVTLQEPAVIAVLTWGLSDRYTWLTKFAPRADGSPVRPLPLDADFNRKPAWRAIAAALDNGEAVRR